MKTKNEPCLEIKTTLLVFALALLFNSNAVFAESSQYSERAQSRLSKNNKTDQLDYRILQDTNYMPMGWACGVHFELDGNTLYVTNIVNEFLKERGQNVCTGDGTCGGQTFEFRCSGNVCTGRGTKITILPDGNSLFHYFDTSETLKAIRYYEKIDVCTGF